jgi:hypothetical protein
MTINELPVLAQSKEGQCEVESMTINLTLQNSRIAVQ